jgi:Domain of unknown function (DUF4166)
MTETSDITIDACGPGRVDFQLLDRPVARHDEEDRFRKLVPSADWAALPVAIRRRFSVALGPIGRRVFTGNVVSVTHSTAGRLLAWVARLLGGPLPYADGAPGCSTVIVTHDERLGGQIWTRVYARTGRMPQTINSVKRFRGPTGLEEHLGAGLVMALTLHAEDCALVFRSAGFAVEIAGWRISLPSALTPGRCTIIHRDLGSGRFSFSLMLDHHWFGRLIHQYAVYEEYPS